MTDDRSGPRGTRISPSVIAACWFLGVVAATAPARSQDPLWGIANGAAPLEKLLVDIDTSTGLQTEVVPPSGNSVLSTGALVGCDGELFGFSLLDTTRGGLYRVDVTTGLFHDVGTFVLAPGAPPLSQGIGFALDWLGDAYLVSDRELYRLRPFGPALPSDGVIEHVGTTGFHTHNSLTMGSDCGLYGGATRTADGRRALVQLYPGGPMFGVERGATDVPFFTTLEPDDGGRLWAHGRGSLYELDSATGELMMTVGPRQRVTHGLGYSRPSACFIPPFAIIQPIGPICETASVTLDGSGSVDCLFSQLVYRWLEAGVVICDWSTSPLCEVSPGDTTTYTLEVRCGYKIGGCAHQAEVTVTVDPSPLCFAGAPFTRALGSSVP